MRAVYKDTGFVNDTLGLVYEFDLRRKMAKCGFQVSLDDLDDYDLEIYHLIANEFLRLENDELKSNSKNKNTR